MNNNNISNDTTSNRPSNAETRNSYKLGSQFGSGQYGQILQCTHIPTNNTNLVAKRMKNMGGQGIEPTTIREISILKSLKHPNIIKVIDVFYISNCEELDLNKDLQSQPEPTKPVVTVMYMVLNRMKMDLGNYMRGKLLKFKNTKKTERPPCFMDMQQIKQFSYEMLNAVAYMHGRGIIHRDLKPWNILITNDEQHIKIADFGLGRDIAGVEHDQQLTQTVVTLHYRPPEILLGCDIYRYKIDIWSLGCIIAEFGRKAHPLFRSQNEWGTMMKIFRMVGLPNDEIWPELMSFARIEFALFPKYAIPDDLPAVMWEELGDFDYAGADLVSKMLALTPDKRYKASRCMRHKWFISLDLVDRNVTGLQVYPIESQGTELEERKVDDKVEIAGVKGKVEDDDECGNNTKNSRKRSREEFES